MIVITRIWIKAGQRGTSEFIFPLNDRIKLNSWCENQESWVKQEAKDKSKCTAKKKVRGHQQSYLMSYGDTQLEDECDWPLKRCRYKNLNKTLWHLSSWLLAFLKLRLIPETRCREKEACKREVLVRDIWPILYSQSPA